ncbi:MAG TPA: hypothetical protein DCY79_21340 [Planctomycetaceae bacterium]|nr:hypothetical protein [Planctomycetaceae bacterium]
MCVVTGWLVPDFSTQYAGWPFVISLFVVGMPHGAVDFLLNAKLKSAGRFGKQVQAFTWYVTILAGGVLALIVFPRLTLLLFAIASAQHFGTADARMLDWRFQTSVPRRIRRCSAFARGVTILALPFVFFPDESVSVINAVTQLVSAAPLIVAGETIAYLATACVIVALASLLVSTTYRTFTGQLRVALVEWLEITVIAAAFWLLHPLFAMGLYLLTWHAWRHLYLVAPLLDSQPRRGNLHELFRCVGRLHVHSLPLLLPTLVLFGVIALWKLPVWDSFHLAALAIATFVVVTLPHHLLVERLFESRRPRQDWTENENASRHQHSNATALEGRGAPG